MTEIQVLLFLVDALRCRMAEARVDRERGDVAEKVVLVGIFVALAIAVGVIITKAVTTDATNISREISGGK